MNPYQTPAPSEEEEVVRAEAVYDEARWYHIACGPAIVSLSVLCWWLFSLGGIFTVCDFLSRLLG